MTTERLTRVVKEEAAKMIRKREDEIAPVIAFILRTECGLTFPEIGKIIQRSIGLTLSPRRWQQICEEYQKKKK